MAPKGASESEPFRTYLSYIYLFIFSAYMFMIHDCSYIFSIGAPFLKMTALFSSTPGYSWTTFRKFLELFPLWWWMPKAWHRRTLFGRSWGLRLLGILGPFLNMKFGACTITRWQLGEFCGPPHFFFDLEMVKQEVLRPIVYF